MPEMTRENREEYDPFKAALTLAYPGFSAESLLRDYWENGTLEQQKQIIRLVALYYGIPEEKQNARKLLRCERDG